MTLYSSDERRKPRCAVSSSYSRPERVRQRLRGQHVEPAAGEARRRDARSARRGRRAPARRTGPCPTRTWPTPRARRGAATQRTHRRVEAGQARAQEQRRAPRVQRAQALPLGGRDVAVGLRRERRVVRVRDRVELGRLEPRLGEAERHRLLRQLPGGERHGRLAVLAAGEALLLGGGDGLAVDDERGGRIVEDGIDSEDRGHGVAVTPLREALRSGGRSSPRS